MTEFVVGIILTPIFIIIAVKIWDWANSPENDSYRDQFGNINWD